MKKWGPTFIVSPVHVAVLLGEHPPVEGDHVPRLAVPLLDPPQVRGLPGPVLDGFVVGNLNIQSMKGVYFYIYKV